MPITFQNGRLLPYILGAPVVRGIDISFPFQPFAHDEALQHFLVGKALLLSEIPFLPSLLFRHVEQGYVQVTQGLTKKDHRYKCNRCGNADTSLFGTYFDERIQEKVVYCRQCITLGKISEIEPLFSWIGPPPSVSFDTTLYFPYTLTPSQQEASDIVKHVIQEQSSLLIWAVCGAGKTEMLFAGIERALQEQKRVALAIPRVDVVHELTPRLKEVFPHVPILAQYGGAKETPTYHPVTIATTHQLLRYKEAFDVVIIDEVDAFPYSTTPMLHEAVQKAKKPSASILYLSATPSEKMKKTVDKTVVIPARYHRHPLPVPRFAWCGQWKKKLKKSRLPKKVLRFLHTRYESNIPVFIFVPSLSVLTEVTTILNKHFDKVDSVHAEDPNRKEKVEAFQKGRVTFLVTTTILERGVTVKGLDVAVLGAEEVIFTEAALVQIAGRVGRKQDAPTGDVVFFHYGVTKAMVKAQAHIEQRNYLAKKAGWID
ncbi:DEAD/DEAH box helicase [Massilibacterium senegalense]|uniref:DEAD/DEAH box helicase n=1 Tax=Massilibacterium senegalense TaxID=1632858 RepID=UPI00093E0866|nr:DEAD/DEAH box helicase [Massilibacterium senegalense]